MFGTVMRARAKPGARERLQRRLEETSQSQAPDGFHCAELAWEDSNPDRLLLIVHFEDKASYLANAASSAQDAEYRSMLEYLEGEPEWIDIHYAGYQGKPLP